MQNDLDLKAKFLPKRLLEFYKVSPKNILSKHSETCPKINLYVWKYSKFPLNRHKNVVPILAVEKFTVYLNSQNRHKNAIPDYGG